MASDLKARRDARKAKILKAGEDRLGKITQLYSNPSETNPPLFTLPDDLGEPAKEGKKFENNCSSQTVSTEQVKQPQPTFKSVSFDSEISASFSSNTFSFFASGTSQAGENQKIEEFSIVSWIHATIFTCIATFFLISWIHSMGSLNHSSEKDTELLTKYEYFNQVCNNLVWMSYNPILHNMGPPVQLVWGNQAMPIWGVFFTLELSLLTIRRLFNVILKSNAFIRVKSHL